MSFAAMMALALVVDACLGWPQRLQALLGHPVIWIGALITTLERRWNTGRPMRRRAAGALTVLAVLGASMLPALGLQLLLPAGAWGVVLGAALAWPMIALRSLHAHVAAVALPLSRRDLTAARDAVAMIVGREPSQLDIAGVARAALESLAENASDGVVAPLFWGVVAGLPGIVAYKAVNTMDSMIGHRTGRYEEFGKAAARLDDLMNLLPARLTGLVIALASARPGPALSVMWRDARTHRSPNAGWPEAAMAGALDTRLSGPRLYADRIAEEPWVNAGAPDPGPEVLLRGLALYRRAMVICGAGLVALALI